MITAVEGWQAKERDVNAKPGEPSERWVDVVAIFCVATIDTRTNAMTVMNGAIVFDPRDGSMRPAQSKEFRSKPCG